MDSPLVVDVQAVRREQLRVARERLKEAQTAEKRHYARIALARAQRNVDALRKED